MQTCLAQILNDNRFNRVEPTEEALVAEYGSDNRAEAIYLLADRFGWQPLYEKLVDMLRDDGKPHLWELAQTVLFFAASDHKHGTRNRPMPADFTIALLYHRFPDGVDDGDRIWAVVCDLKGVKHWSNYDPRDDSAIIRELEALKTYPGFRGVGETGE